MVTVEVAFENGVFSIHDARNREALLSEATIGADSGEFPPAVTLLKREAVQDELGRGERLIVASADCGLFSHSDHHRSGALPPERLQSFTLYEGSPALVLGFGLRTPSYYSMRLMGGTVLSNGTLFGGNDLVQPLTLNGAAGAEPTLVKSVLSRTSCNSLMLTGRVRGKRRTVVWGGLGNQAFGKIASLKDGVPGLVAEDPIGVLVDEDQEYLSGDTFYLDLSTPEPFEALERYGRAMRQVNHACPNVYDFPVLCGWSVGAVSKLPWVNNSAKLVEEADHANACGMTRYTRVSFRLEPDKYHEDTEQGWWDDEHFCKFEHLVPPYDSMAKWCAALKERNGVPYTYMQLGMPSDDFARAHPEYMLFNDASEVDRQAPNLSDGRKHRHHMPYVTYDYTDREFSEHLVKVWSAIRQAGVRGVKIDYPATAWRAEGGFDDRYASTNSAYRRAFELMRQAMGNDGLIDERNLGETGRPCLDVTAGLVDTQRTWTDSNQFLPEMISRSGLRWYKNRSVFNYYSDTKAVHELSEGKLQSLITMNFLTSGRLDLATSFSLFTPEITRIISRSYPHYPEPKTARPVDAFTGVRDPQVYDLEHSPDWHQVVLYNTGGAKALISTAISGDRVNNAIGLDPDANYHAYEFWTDSYLGRLSGRARLGLDLESEHCAMISLRKVQVNPQVVSTDRHLLQGWVDLCDVCWAVERRTLCGMARVIGGEPFKIVIADNGFTAVNASTDGAEVELQVHPVEGLHTLVLSASATGDVSWAVDFRR